MIQITKKAEPQVLHDHKDEWTKNLDDLVIKYGSYKKIPDALKKKALDPYSHPDIVEALRDSQKFAHCVFCESLVDVSGYLQVEHYHPKSLYWKEAFCWDNLFVSCGCCNAPKSNFDTKNLPFIHPVDDDPEKILTFCGISYKPVSTDPNTLEYQKACNVISVCELHRKALKREHSDLALGFANIEDGLTSRLEHYKRIRQNAAKVKDAKVLLNTLVDIKKDTVQGANYAGFMRYLVRGSYLVREAVSVVNTHKEALGMAADFSWEFNYPEA